MLNTRLDRAPITRSVHIATILALALIAPPAAGFGACQAAQAQSRASLSGTIVDPSGAAVSNADVRLTTASGEERAATIDAEGRFTFAGVTPGEYLLEVRAEGFAPAEERVTLSPDERIERRVPLAVGSVSESIVIAGPKAGAAPTLLEMPERARAEFAAARAARQSTVQAPERVRSINPVYPTPLQSAGVSGTVTLDARITTEGRVVIDRIEPTSPPELVAAARAAVLEWRYDPTRLHGVPIETPMLVTIEFVP